MSNRDEALKAVETLLAYVNDTTPAKVENEDEFLRRMRQSVTTEDGLYYDPQDVYNSNGYELLRTEVGMKEYRRLRAALDLSKNTYYSVWEVIETAAEQLEKVKKNG